MPKPRGSISPEATLPSQPFLSAEFCSLPVETQIDLIVAAHLGQHAIPQLIASENLSMWAVYDHPKDFPNMFVAREFLVGLGHVWPTQNLIQSKTPSVIRRRMLDMGMICLVRDPDDDPVILEVWL
jgi:hypothetical protein